MTSALCSSRFGMQVNSCILSSPMPSHSCPSVWRVSSGLPMHRYYRLSLRFNAHQLFIVPVTLLLSSKIKQFQNVLFSMRGRAAWIWLARSAWAFVCAQSDTLPSVRSFSNLSSTLFAFGSPLHVRGVLVELIPSMGEG